MTEKEAKTFKRFSKINAAILCEACSECEPYKDWYTYKRWKAQKKQVGRGQRGVKLSIILETKKEDKDGKIETNRRPWRASVFCRHQLNK